MLPPRKYFPFYTHCLGTPLRYKIENNIACVYFYVRKYFVDAVACARALIYRIYNIIIYLVQTK